MTVLNQMHACDTSTGSLSLSLSLCVHIYAASKSMRLSRLGPECSTAQGPMLTDESSLCISSVCLRSACHPPAMLVVSRGCCVALVPALAHASCEVDNFSRALAVVTRVAPSLDQSAQPWMLTDESQKPKHVTISSAFLRSACHPPVMLLASRGCVQLCLAHASCGGGQIHLHS